MEAMKSPRIFWPSYAPTSWSSKESCDKLLQTWDIFMGAKLFLVFFFFTVLDFFLGFVPLQFFHGFLQFFHGFSIVFFNCSMVFFNFPWFSSIFHGFLQAFHGVLQFFHCFFQCFPGFLQFFHGFPWFSPSFPWFSSIFPWFSSMFPWFSSIFRCKFSMVFFNQSINIYICVCVRMYVCM